MVLQDDSMKSWQMGKLQGSAITPLASIRLVNQYTYPFDTSMDCKYENNSHKFKNMKFLSN